jgi:tRNA A-37 threonylcarbamoyl transferase component Bud32
VAANAPDTVLLKPGTVLGERFEIVDVLGEGTMGVVHRAHDRLAGRDVVVKVLKRTLLSSKEFVARFKREARAASRFRHPAAVAVLATGETEDRLPFIAMELVGGRPMEEILAAEAPMAPGRACNIAQQLLRALGTAHHMGIVHRDMRPENIRIVVDEDGVERPKILDFGVAKFLRNDTGDVSGAVKTKTGVILGTPRYMAPEQLRGESVDGRADVWSVGVMLYEMLSGKPPLDATDVFGLVTLMLKKDVDPLTQRFPDLDIPHEVDEIVLRMLQKDPKQRPDDAAALAEELERWAVEDPGAAQKAVAVRNGAAAVLAAGVAGAVAVWFVARPIAATASAAALGLGIGAAVAASKFGRPSVYAYVKRTGAVLGALVVLCGVSMFVPGGGDVTVTAAFILAALVAYAAFLFVWSSKAKWLRVLTAGVAAPLLCAALFPVRVLVSSKSAYYVDLAGLYHTGDEAQRAVESAAKNETVLALLAVAGLFGLASVLLPRPGAARTD